MGRTTGLRGIAWSGEGLIGGELVRGYIPVGKFADAYPLNEEQVDALRELTGETFHPGSYEYFIEAVEG
ncbi:MULTISPECIES: DUF7683 domain-containing protein [Streptomyces]|uniref:DUF7683 domain-containing protein n=1 Tax=Streptomyces TaxID=1883 RepID=UPI002699F02D